MVLLLVHLAACSPSFGDAFLTQIARNLTDPIDGFLKDKRCVLVDWVSNFSDAFCTILKDVDVKPVPLPPKSLNLSSGDWPDRWFGRMKDFPEFDEVADGVRLLMHRQQLRGKPERTVKRSELLAGGKRNATTGSGSHARGDPAGVVAIFPSSKLGKPAFASLPSHSSHRTRSIDSDGFPRRRSPRWARVRMLRARYQL